MNSTTRIFSTVLAKRKWFLLAILGVAACLWIAGLSSGAKEETLPEIVDYNFHIRPILSDKCFTCHGPDANKREAGLRLDEELAAKAELTESPGKFAIVAGDVIQSELVHRIWTADENELMPPPESNLKLTERERRLLEKWIEDGAEFKQHWAYIPPQKVELPEVKKTSWVKNEIDPFVLEKLDELGLAPNPMADKERLLKRAAFDLTGLPPTVEMQDRFLADESSDAYEKVLDELMESKHYGEKMALHWLDVARYADSHGYQDDGLRTMWPWRDWVIHAFNENYSYDKFLTWQLAGDLFPNANKEMLLATGFNRNHKITQEGGVIDEEYRIEYVTDRTNTFGKAFLGLTYECAKCHDHKYDPISQQNYFEAFAFFNQVPEKGLFGTIDANFADPPNMQIFTEDVEELLSFVNKKDSMPVKVMIMQDSADMRSTHILDRGNYDAPTTEVSPFMPDFIFPFDNTKFEQNRLGLAKWLLADEHPLTARVFVNRIWQEIFGTGIVKSSGDFGMQGDLPTHLELLDYLSVDFRESGWDIKHLMKKILMSATYRQSSEADKRKLERDPDNLYFSRFPRRRLNAEFVKDHVLASSGLLNPEIGGPSVKPYQPDG
ncbi:MAG: PSD1 and planctomycete cytochrome C domain-containing protein, partial [Bacteroidota bacterium]